MTPEFLWLDTPAVHGYLLGRGVADHRDATRAASRYEKLVAQGKNVKLWDDALKQQIYLGDEAFIERMQALQEPERARANEVPRIQRRARPDSIQSYLKTYMRDEAIVRACREGGHTLSAIAREVGLSVSRVSRIVVASEQLGAKVETCSPDCDVSEFFTSLPLSHSLTPSLSY